MSPVRVSVMLSLVAVATSNLVMVGGNDVHVAEDKCSEFVEQPSKCSETPGCKVVNEWDCVADEEPTGKVWLQFPESGLPATPGLPPLSLEDKLIPGVPVTGSGVLPIGHDVEAVDVPNFLKGTLFHAVEQIQKGGGLRFECPPNHDHVPCDFFVTVFSCGHCGMQVDGGFPEVLTVTNGWEPRSCGPMMRVQEEVGSSDYKMKIFRVRVPAGSSMETPRVQRTAHYIGVFSSMEETEYCPIPAKVSGPFPPGKTCGAKCPFDFEV